jgi:hypothetical protein
MRAPVIVLKLSIKYLKLTVNSRKHKIGCEFGQIDAFQPLNYARVSPFFDLFWTLIHLSSGLNTILNEPICNFETYPCEGLH